MQDPRSIFINYRKTFEKIVYFRHLNKNQQDQLILDIRQDTEQVINELLLIQELDKKHFKDQGLEDAKT